MLFNSALFVEHIGGTATKKVDDMFDSGLGLY